MPRKAEEERNSFFDTEFQEILGLKLTFRTLISFSNFLYLRFVSVKLIDCSDNRKIVAVNNIQK